MRISKKTTAKIVATLLAITIIIVGMPISVSAVASTPPDYVTASTDKALWADGATAATTNNIDAVKWYAKKNTYYWSLPSSADLSNLTVYHNFDSVKINGNTITSGNSYSFFENGQTYTVIADDKEYSLCVQKATGIGSIFLTTESGSMRNVHLDIEHKESGQLVAIDYDGSVSYDNKLDYIKGRGHSTWRLSKKPYNIKLDKKASLLGMDKNKKWCLLANAQEHSMIRNKFMYDLGHEMGIDYSPDSRFVDLYANGQYMGTYQLTQKIEAGDGELVDITDLQKNTEEAVANALGIEEADLEELYGDDTYSVNEGLFWNERKAFNIPYNPDDITGGYLMEFVTQIDEPSSFITERVQMVNVKAPEYCSVEQINYIANFMQDLEDALYSADGYNSKGKHFTEYIDLRSAAIMYLLQEFSLNIDGGISSCYFYKDSDITGDGKVHASPCWDFDVALGNLNIEKDGVHMTDYNSWFIKNSWGVSDYTIFAQLCQHEEFLQEVEKVWNEKFVPAYNIAMGNTAGTGRLKSIYEYDALLESSSIMNYTKWDITTTLLVPESGKTQDEQMKYLENFIKGRFEFLNNNIPTMIESVLESYKLKCTDYLRLLTSSHTDRYSPDIPEEKAVIDNMMAILTQAINDINNATSKEEVDSIYKSVATDILKCHRITIYFDNSKAKWDNVYVYSCGKVWDKETNKEIVSSEDAGEWPGTKMTYVGNDIYKFTLEGFKINDLSVSIPTIIFNNGETKESGNNRQTIATTWEYPIWYQSTTYMASASAKNFDDEENAYIHTGRWDNFPMIGDVDRNAEVDLTDAVLIMKHILGAYELDELAKYDADVDFNEEIDLLDAVYVQKYILGLIDDLPANDWY
ncbi:MAG: CotH kinase family protein [Acutalibacteraceae bacterium]|nr:CotH kinase family protein [Acutalibacteraceae bacterium]